MNSAAEDGKLGFIPIEYSHCKLIEDKKSCVSKGDKLQEPSII